MPGFPKLPDERELGRGGALLAAELWRGGRKDEAVVVLEETLRECLASGSPPPSWLVVRLATAYGFVYRYGDEVALLERHLGDGNEQDRAQLGLLLSRARTLAERHARKEAAQRASAAGQRKPGRPPASPSSSE